VRYDALGRRGAYGLGVHRAALFSLLHEAAGGRGPDDRDRPDDRRQPLRRRTPPAAVRRRRRSRSLRPGDRRAGSNSALAPPTGRTLAYGALWASLDWPPEAGFDPAALEQRYRRASVMAGVLPIGAAPGRDDQTAFFWSLRTDRLQAWRDAGLDAWKSDVLALWPAVAPLLDQIASPDQLTFARYAHRTLEAPAGRALAHIGDSWHSASPQLGQGANMALLDAYALARALRSEADVAWALARYEALRARHVRLYQWMSSLFTPVYQSDSRLLPLVRDRLVGPLAGLWPATAIQAAMVSGWWAIPSVR
jgi:2-polyprenyl-6-methoxyphenol hydroxylase-like FAD-dependent oxidoreductase